MPALHVKAVIPSEDGGAAPDGMPQIPLPGGLQFRRVGVVEQKSGFGFYVGPKASDIVIEGNQIADTRSTGGTQRYGIYKLLLAGLVEVARPRRLFARDRREAAACSRRAGGDNRIIVKTYAYN
jgi:hypothetical protein